MNDTRFWNAVEKLEGDFCCSNIDEKAFRSKMKRKGFPPEVIEERVEGVKEQQVLTYGVSA